LPKAYLVEQIPKECKKTTQKTTLKEPFSVEEIENALKILNLEYKSLNAIEIYNLFHFIMSKKKES
jgi:hypothetical protein